MSASNPTGVAQALFGKTLSAVLALLFGRPGEAFYTREIVKHVGTGGSQVQKELERLTAAGLILREQRGNQVFYRANSASAVYRELVGLVGKSFGIPDQIRAVLEAFADRIRFACIFGSVARGEHRADSDVDLLIVGDVRLSELAIGLHEAEMNLGMPISLTVLTQDEFELRRSRKDHFLETVLSGEWIVVLGSPNSLEKS